MESSKVRRTIWGVLEGARPPGGEREGAIEGRAWTSEPAQSKLKYKHVLKQEVKAQICMGLL
jgi:hypothetical protein